MFWENVLHNKRVGLIGFLYGQVNSNYAVNMFYIICPIVRHCDASRS